MKAVYAGGLYDTWSSAGGDVRTVKDRAIGLCTAVLSGSYYYSAILNHLMQDT